MSADGDHACALTLGGAVYCWGAHPVGEDLSFGGTVSAAEFSALCAAGTSTASNYPCIATLPVPITGGAGNTMTCGVTSANVVYCWGLNQDAELGNGTISDHVSAPVRVGG